MKYLFLFLITFICTTPRIITKPSYEYSYDYDDGDYGDEPEIQQPHFTTAALLNNVTVSLGQNAVLKCEVENLGNHEVKSGPSLYFTSK